MDMNEQKPSHFFSHRACEYFPCHETSAPEEFNCLFCYCPLYALGDACGGNFTYTQKGVKSCAGCLIPHTRDGRAHILSKISGVIDMARRDQKT
jgi:Zn-finger protein